MFGTSWAALRQSLADTMDRALDTYWDNMRETDPDVMLLASQTEVLVADAGGCKRRQYAADRQWPPSMRSVARMRVLPSCCDSGHPL